MTTEQPGEQGRTVVLCLKVSVTAGPPPRLRPGAHFRMGAPPARLEGRIVLGLLPDRFPEPRVAAGDGSVAYHHPKNVVGPRRLDAEVAAGWRNSARTVRTPGQGVRTLLVSGRERAAGRGRGCAPAEGDPAGARGPTARPAGHQVTGIRSISGCQLGRS